MPNKKSLLLLGLLATAISTQACTLMPDYLRPKPPVAKEWPLAETVEQGEADAQPQTPTAQIARQHFFADPVLQQLIATALENNRDLRIAALNIEEARALYRIRRADYWPDIDGQVRGTRQRIQPQVQGFGQGVGASQGFINEFYVAQVSAAYELDLFGRIRSLNKAALENYLATEEARKAVQVSLIAETVNAYLQLQADQRIAALAEETVNAQLKAQELITARFEQGISGKLDVSRSTAVVETARANHALYTRRAMQDKNALMVLLGVPEIDASLLAVRENTVELPTELPSGLPSEVLLLRPDVKRAEHYLISANADIGAARAALFPSISLTGSYGRASAELGDLFSGNSGTVWSFVPAVTIPIFQAGRGFGNIDAAHARKEIAVAEYEKAIQVAFREVADELAARATLDTQFDAQSNLVQASQDAYDLSDARYREGVDNFLSVLDAQRELFTAQQNLIELERQRLANLVNLYKVLGGGQVSDPESKTSDNPAAENAPTPAPVAADALPEDASEGFMGPIPQQ